MNQKQFIVNKLLTDGKVTRNFALRNYISRLSAIMCDLTKDGWDFDTKYIEVDTPFGKGKDYEYKVLSKPSEVA